MQIYLSKIFNGINNYSIIKMQNRRPEIGEDIDVLTNDINLTVKLFIKNLNSLYKNCQIKKREGKRGNVHVDIYEDQKFMFKIDISDSLNNLFPNFEIPGNYIISIIKNSYPNDNGVMIPKLEDEMSLRWMEYETFKDERPDKIKHLKFIQKQGNVKFIKFNKINC